MQNTNINSTQFKDALAGLKTSSGQKGMRIGTQSLFGKVLPLTNYLVNVLWKERPDDSTKVAVAKAAARGLTYFFTVATAAPLYQFLLHTLPKTVSIADNHSGYAKKILESLHRYNALRHEIIKAGDHERDYLAPQNIAERDAEIDAHQGIVIKLSPEEQTKVKENIRRLQKEKADNYDRILGEQIKEITTYLKALPAEDRVGAYQEILGAFMTHVGFDDVFIRKNERFDFALEISNRIGIELIKNTTKEHLEKLSTNNNFIKFNDAMVELATDIAAIFGITTPIATTLVAQAVKERVQTTYGSLERFTQHFVPHLDDVAKTDTAEFQVFIDSIQNNYNTTIEELDETYENLHNGAVLKDAVESLALLNKDILDLRRESARLAEFLKTINQKLKVLGDKGSFHNFKKIKETKAELEKAKQEAHSAYKETLKQIQEKLKQLAAINNLKDVNFNGPEVQALKKTAEEHLELERQTREAHANLGIKNTRAFRACMHLLNGVTLETPAESQFVQVNSLAQHLKDETQSFETRWEKVSKAFGFGPTVKPVALFDVLRAHLATFAMNSLQARNAVRTAYEKMSPAQQAYFAQEVARQAGKRAAFYQTGTLTEFGKKYIEGYIAGDVTKVDDITISPQTIKNVVDSEQGKAAALYRPYIHFTAAKA